ncbi:MAG: hypothetical protein LBT50_11660 [Prevotellaceae bacterium]|jgi:hypothetical protein|nr:hypothetical protein [Prevotellaceae bacterium]
MNNTDYVPRKDADFALWVVAFYDYLNNNAFRFNIPPEVVPALSLLLVVWQDKYSIAEHVDTRTKTAVIGKDAARKALETSVREVVKEYLTANHLVTDEDRTSMGLPIHKSTRTPAIIPADAPEGTVVTGPVRCISIHFRKAGSKSNAKPAHVYGAELKYVIADAKPVDMNEFTNSVIDTASPVNLTFKEEERGKTVYFCLCWVNTRGEKGPYSGIESAIIP